MIRLEQFSHLVCGSETPIREVLGRINSASLHLFQVVVDHDGRVSGTVTDGDVRRAMLRGVTIDDAVSQCMHSSPIVGRAGEDQGEPRQAPRRPFPAFRRRATGRLARLDCYLKRRSWHDRDEVYHPTD